VKSQREVPVGFLPVLGEGESYFHASFSFLATPEEFVEGVVGASTGAEALSLLLQEEAHARCILSFSSALELVDRQSGQIGRLTIEQAAQLGPKVKHRISMWKGVVSPPATNAPQLEFAAL